MATSANKQTDNEREMEKNIAFVHSHDSHVANDDIVCLNLCKVDSEKSN